MKKQRFIQPERIRNRARMIGINEKRLERTFAELVRIDAPTLQERPVSDYLKRQFSRLGLKTEEDRAAPAIQGNSGNLLVRMPGGNPRAPGMIFAAHLDTILPTRGLVLMEKDGIFRSDGSTILGADDRAGVAVILELARSLAAEGGSHVPLEFLFTVGEEKGLLGVKRLKKGWLKGRIAYVLDSGGPAGVVVNRAPFGEQIRVVIRGKAAHAGVEPELGVSAIKIAGRAIAAMRLGKVNRITTANIGKITGGEATNIIPEKAEIEAEARSLMEKSLLRQVRHMRKTFAVEARRLKGEVDFRSQREYPGFCVPSRSLAVSLVRRAAGRLKLLFILQASCGASDANFINALGIVALDLSVGYLKPHTREESISREELINAGRLVYEIVRAAGEL